MTQSLVWVPALERPELLADSVRAAIENEPGLAGVEVTEIDPGLSDTEALCAHYGVAMADCANCVVVAGRRGENVTLAACLVLASTRADVNGVVRRQLNARKASFAPLAEVEAASGMEFGAITPIGLPDGWPVLMSPAVAEHPQAIIGSGVRRSKLRLPGAALTTLAAAEVLAGLALAAS